MASSRKKQDEKNLKTLRQLGALPQNKYCFDCNQRGPTYVNVTIGSFVCTKCSGMLRGITPPHRVKSISMATFTSEEIDLLRNRGNEYCRKVWLGLHEGTPPSMTGDEQTIRDHMVEKYERRRYYLDPGLGYSEVSNARPALSDSKPVKMNGVNGTVQTHSTLRTRPEVNKNNINNNNSAIFVADFDKADIFSSTGNGNLQVQKGTASFANFDNNPAFSNTSTNTTTTAGMPTPATFNNVSNWNNQQNNTSNSLNGSLNSTLKGPGPLEDKYAALKDLDNEIKSQKNFEWSSTGSNGSLYSSPTPTGSMYSSPSPQSSIFGSPSQGQFLSAFPAAHENGTATISNPFSNAGGATWGTNGNGLQQNQQPFANPFRDGVKMNGFSQVFQPITFPVNSVPVPVNGTGGWAPNPFKVGATSNTNSNNPFL